MKYVYTILGIFVLFCVFMAGRSSVGQRDGIINDTTIVDTVKYRKPVPVDSIVVRYITKTLPIKKDSLNVGDSIVYDSIPVEIPITQKEYSDDSTYRAWVSGYEPHLDSIHVYRKNIYVFEKPKPKPQRGFSWGLQGGAGYGLIHGKSDIFIGFGGSYSF
ncbi:hypothetical protein L6472_05900 [Prevotella sp. E13-17]|uniref:DUF6808 domain-containing protein n=1 Tax=Prevotella sp. E13-17 TaxID=2913616 RepID=UPI001EDA826C|nr:hypothetical protein [Prevotella sp. E13-17]UKK52110.1 hypothetical protein L6472_05900 [Prevotella sp. E13-17]